MDDDIAECCAAGHGSSVSIALDTTAAELKLLDLEGAMASLSGQPQPDALLKGCLGNVGHCTGPVAYIWTTPHGGEAGLCIRHCAEWRGYVRGSALVPARVRLAA